MVRSFSDICECALKIDKPIALGWRINYYGYPNVTVHEMFRPSLNYPYEHMFRVENEVLAFVKDKVTYVIPATKNVMEVFTREKRFVISDYITVPCSNGEVPVGSDTHKFWADLIERKNENTL